MFSHNTIICVVVFGVCCDVTCKCPSPFHCFASFQLHSSPHIVFLLTLRPTSSLLPPPSLLHNPIAISIIIVFPRSVMRMVVFVARRPNLAHNFCVFVALLLCLSLSLSLSLCLALFSFLLLLFFQLCKNSLFNKINEKKEKKLSQISVTRSPAVLQNWTIHNINKYVHVRHWKRRRRETREHFFFLFFFPLLS